MCCASVAPVSRSGVLVGLILSQLAARGETCQCGNESGVGVDPTVKMTATFGKDGKVNGSGGCNNDTATYTTDGGAVEV
jgi:heat shock protein HslJ